MKKLLFFAAGVYLGWKFSPQVSQFVSVYKLPLGVPVAPGLLHAPQFSGWSAPRLVTDCFGCR